MGGLGLAALGIAIETLADVQKWSFKQATENAGKFCYVGLWQISQHPNWFGNLVTWAGILVLNVPTLLASNLTPLTRAVLFTAACLSPLFLVSLFYSQATGLVSPSIDLVNQRYGADSRYQAH